MYLQSEVRCEIVRDECKFYVPGMGPFDNFLIVGQGRYTEDQNLLQECEEKALIRKRGK